MGELRSQLVEILAEQSRMAARAEEQEREQDLMRAEHHRALADLETSKGLALAELRGQLAERVAAQDRLAARVEELELARNHLIAEHHRALDDVETSRREALAVAAESRSRLEQSSAEQSSLTARIQEHERERDRVIAEHHRTVADMETGKRDALAELRSQLSQAFADQRRLASRVEEHERQLDRAVADHQGALAEMETGKRDALAELRSQLSQAFANERRLAARVDEQDLERDRMRAEHYRVLADLETRKRDALTGLRAQVSQTAAEHSGILAALAETHETERARMNNDHYRAIADLQASKGEALAELRSQLSQSSAEHGRLTALLEEYDRERERIGAEHRRAIADLQVSKREAMAECERVLTEVQQALLVRDGSRLEIERRLVDAIDEGPPKKADGEIIASLQGGLTLAVSEMQAVFKDEEALERPTGETIDKATAVSETQTVLTDVDPLPELFDGADDAFVRHLLEGMREPPLPEDPADARVGSAQAVSERLTVTAGDQPAHDMFDAQDDAFAVHLMEGSPVQAREPTDETNAQPPHELPEKEPPAPEDS